MSEPTNPGSHSSSRLSAEEGQEVGLGSPIKHRTHSLSPFDRVRLPCGRLQKENPFPSPLLHVLSFTQKSTHISSTCIKITSNSPI